MLVCLPQRDRTQFDHEQELDNLQLQKPRVYSLKAGMLVSGIRQPHRGCRMDRLHSGAVSESSDRDYGVEMVIVLPAWVEPTSGHEIATEAGVLPDAVTTAIV